MYAYCTIKVCWQKYVKSRRNISISTKHKLQRPSLEKPLSARNTLLTVPHSSHLYKHELTNSDYSHKASISRKAY